MLPLKLSFQPLFHSTNTMENMAPHQADKLEIYGLVRGRPLITQASLSKDTHSRRTTTLMITTINFISLNRFKHYLKLYIFPFKSSRAGKILLLGQYVLGKIMGEFFFEGHMRDWFLEQMAMYSAYHRDKRNQATHHFGVPLIVFALLFITTGIPIVKLGVVWLSLATLLMTVLLLVYIYCVPLVGTLAVFLYGSLLMFADHLWHRFGDDQWPIFAVLFIGGWIIQFIGHYYEGRRPALFDNLLQIFMAPAFLIAEILFHFGFETALKAELENRMGHYGQSGD